MAVLEWIMAATINTARSPTRMLPKEFMVLLWIAQLSVGLHMTALLATNGLPLVIDISWGKSELGTWERH